MPASIVFCDVETTGLGESDRVITFAGIGLRTAALANGQFDLSYSHLVFDPGKKSHSKAELAHGYSDWSSRFQDPFSVYADELWQFLRSYELFVAHNAAFDFEFISREMRFAGLPTLALPMYCTMEGYRARGIGGSASLNAVCQRINLTRAGHLHGALEDAWLAMQVYLWLHDCPLRADLPSAIPLTPTNLHDAPPELEGRTPRRKWHGQLED
jgi:DNA polymerase-3 subunit epsilon